VKPLARLVTDAQRRVLVNLRLGREVYDGLCGMAAMGGLTSTLASMRKRGWLSGQNQLTIDGNELCDQIGIERRP
jgi:hypothetical protein